MDAAARIRKADAEQAFALARTALHGGDTGVRLVDDGARAELAFFGIGFAVCERSGQGVVVSFLVEESDRAGLPADAGYEPDPARAGWYRVRLGKDPRRWQAAAVETLVGRTLARLRRIADLGRWASLPSSGAPFVAVPRECLARWSDEDAAAALAAPGPASVVERAWGSALVLRGLPPVYMHLLAHGVMFVRVTTRASAEESRLRELVAALPEEAFESTGRTLSVSGPLALLDGAAPDAARTPGKVFDFELEAGRYRIDVGRYDAGEGIVLSFVRLVRELGR